MAASAGSAASQHDLGIAYDLGHGVQKDHSEAVRWWTKAAEAGLANSQVNLFIAYSMGKGVKASDKLSPFTSVYLLTREEPLIGSNVPPSVSFQGSVASYLCYFMLTCAHSDDS